MCYAGMPLCLRTRGVQLQLSRAVQCDHESCTLLTAPSTLLTALSNRKRAWTQSRVWQ